MCTLFCNMHEAFGFVTKLIHHEFWGYLTKARNAGPSCHLKTVIPQDLSSDNSSNVCRSDKKLVQRTRICEKRWKGSPMARQLKLPQNSNTTHLTIASLLIWGSIGALVAWGVTSAYPVFWRADQRWSTDDWAWPGLIISPGFSEMVIGPHQTSLNRINFLSLP